MTLIRSLLAWLARLLWRVTCRADARRSVAQCRRVAADWERDAAQQAARNAGE